MKKLSLAFTVAILGYTVFGQSPEKLILKKNVTRIINTLTADDMMGRSATRPEHIDKAAAFIESEFIALGLHLSKD